MANELSKLVVGDTTYDIKDVKAARKGMYVGTCTTDANTYAKVATVDTFPVDGNGKPLEGTIVGIKYSNSNSYKTAGQYFTLNVNNTGAYRMYYNNAELATSTSINTLVAGYKNRYIYYMFDNDHWVWLTASYETNSTYAGYSFGLGLGVQDNASASATITVTLASYTLGIGGVTSVRFLYDVPANSTMNINRKGAKSIYYKNAAIGAGVIKAGDTATFVYSSQYHLIAIDRWDDDIKAKANSADLATVATSGSYNDLSNKPTIPSLADAKPFIIEVTSSGSEDEITYSSQTTPLEIKSAVEAGRNIIVRYSGGYYYLTGYGAGDDYVNAVFSQSAGNSGSMDAIASSIIMESFLDGGVWSVDWYYDEREYIQPDWNVTNDSSAAFIKNKPTIPTVDSSLTGSSQTNPVQGGAIYSALQRKTEVEHLSFEYDDVEDTFTFYDSEGNTITDAEFRDICNSKYVFLFDAGNGVPLAPTKLEMDSWWFTGNLGLTDGVIVSFYWSSSTNNLDGAYSYNEIVPTTRKINNKPLTTDITLTASDVEADVFVVNIESDGNDGYTCDKTNAEIYAAWQANRSIICLYEYRVLILYSEVSSTAASFDGLDPEDYNSRILIDIYVRDNTQVIDVTHVSYQSYLVSGTNIKTINNQSLLGSGNLTASDVGAMSTSHPANAITSVKIADWDAKADPVPIVTVSTTGAVTQALDPDKFYNFTGSPTSLTLTLNSGTGLCIYAGKFTAGTGFSNLTFPSTVKVADGAPSVEAGGVYEFSVLDNLLLLAKKGE